MGTLFGRVPLAPRVASLHDRWRLGRSEFVILAGCLVAFAGNYALLAWTLIDVPPDAWPVPVAFTATELALCVLTPWVLARRKARTARNFVVVAILATAIALLNVPGLVGGGIALAGAMIGILATYEGVADATRS